MNLRWLWFDYVPPWAPLSASQRRTVRRRITAARRNNRVDPWLRLAVSIPLVGSYASMVLALFFLAPSRTAGIQWPLALRLAAIAAGCWIIAAVLAQWFFGRRVARTLRDLRYKVCHACGYDLRGSDEFAPCPECGSTAESVYS